jgi:nitroreductase
LSIESSILSSQRVLQDAIQRGVECAMSAPNHKITEPTTFHRILTPSTASERLLDISYEVTYQRLLLNKLSGVEACRNEAIRKRDKWANVPAFLVAAVGGMEDQYNHETEDVRSPYEELSLTPPRSIQQLEDYASSCASIQNLLLSLHSEGLASKWSTGPIIRTSALRELVGCGKNDMIVGLIMIGWPKRVPRMPRRRRDRDGDVLKDVII